MNDTPTSELMTKRLSLRPVATADVRPLHALWTQEPVRRFLWDGEIVPLEQAREIVERNRTLIETFGLGIFGLREHGSGTLLGFAGFWHFHEPPALELLYGVASEHWGRGFATEAARRVVDHGFETLGFETIGASTDPPNVASMRVLEKLGMVPTRRETLTGHDTAFFELRRKAWARSRRT